jgi:hypothetical protein
VNGFIDHVYTRLGTTSNYSATANLHNSQIATAHSKPSPACCVFIRRSLVTAPNSGDSSVSRLQVLSSQPPMRNRTNVVPCLYVTSRHRPHRKHPVSNRKYCCLHIRCHGNVFTEPLPRNCRCLRSHCSATGLYAAILYSVFHNSLWDFGGL